MKTNNPYHLILLALAAAVLVAGECGNSPFEEGYANWIFSFFPSAKAAFSSVKRVTDGLLGSRSRSRDDLLVCISLASALLDKLRSSISFSIWYAITRFMAVASASFVVMTNIDKVFIQLFWGAAQVGEYFAIFNLNRFVILFSTSAAMLLVPTISEYHSKRDAKKITQ